MRTAMRLLAIGWLVCGSAAYGDEGNPQAFNPPKDPNLKTQTPPFTQTLVAPDEKALAGKQKALEAEAKYKKNMNDASIEANVEIKACKDKYLEGKIKTNTQLVNCYNTKVSAIFSHAGYRYPDLLRALSNKRIEIARLVDKKVMSDAKGEAALAEFSAGIAKEEQRREANTQPEATAPQ